MPLTARGRRRKGARVELELVKLHIEHGIQAKKVPLSGATWMKGDLLIGPAPHLVAEVKARGKGQGFATLERWLGENDCLILKRNHADPFVVVPWQTWVRLLTSGSGK